MPYPNPNPNPNPNPTRTRTRTLTRRQLFDAATLLTSWSPWGSLGGETSSGPTVATRGDGLLDVIVRGADRNLYRKPQRFVAADKGNASTSNQLRWGSWEFLGGPVRNFPC